MSNKRNIVSFLNKAKNKKPPVKKYYRKYVVFTKNHPFGSFFVALGVLFLVIFLGSTVFRVKPVAEETKTQAKHVAVFRMDESPKIRVQGEIKKDGVIKILAQTPGIVSFIPLHEGEEVAKGGRLINLSTNYQGGNAASLQRQLAGLAYKNVKETYDTQNEIIKKQREIALKQDASSDEMRRIAQQSLGDTQAVIRLDEELLSSIETNLQNLQNSNGYPQDILATQQVKSQYLSAITQIKSAQRNAELQANDNGSIAALSDLGRDIALKQLDLQEKALKLSLDTSSVQLKLASVQESLMFPSAPFKGIIQKVHVKVGDMVSPGTPLVTLAGGTGNVVIDAKVPQHAALEISRTQNAVIEINGKQIEAAPSYISTEATAGQLYSVLFYVDDSYRDLFTDNAFVNVSLPLGNKSETTTQFIPVDSIFQTQNESFVFVVNGNKAVSKKVKLGEVTGRFVQIVEGLNKNDVVILSRNIVSGDQITIEN